MIKLNFKEINFWTEYNNTAYIEKLKNKLSKLKWKTDFLNSSSC